MSGGQWPGPGIAGASRHRPGETPGTGSPASSSLASPGCSLAARASHRQPSQLPPGREARLQRGAGGGGPGARHGQTDADRTGPGPAQIRRYSQASQHTVIPGPRPSRGCNQATQSVSQGATLWAENNGQFMMCRMCALSLSVPPPAPAAGLPPPPPWPGCGPGESELCSLLSPVPTRHIVPDRSLSLKKQSL